MREFTCGQSPPGCHEQTNQFQRKQPRFAISRGISQSHHLQFTMTYYNHMKEMRFGAVLHQGQFDGIALGAFFRFKKQRRSAGPRHIPYDCLMPGEKNDK